MSAPLIDVKGLTMGWDDVVLQKNATFHVDGGIDSNNSPLPIPDY